MPPFFLLLLRLLLFSLLVLLARGMGAERFFLAGGFNLKVGRRKDEEEFVDFCGPLCWESREADLVSCRKKHVGGYYGIVWLQGDFYLAEL